MDDTTTALPQTCVRCEQLAMIRIVGRCGDCLADMGLRNPEDYTVWQADVLAKYGAK